MPILIGVTLMWAFSFSWIGVYLAGQVDAWFSVLMRVALATVIFLPFLKLRQIEAKVALQLMVCGAFQLGIMYGFYYQSFLYLSVPEVLLFTVMTPIYITLLNDLLERRLNIGFIISSLLAVIGAVTIRYQGIDEGFLKGFLIVQGANLCFAAGQVGYKRTMAKERTDLPQRNKGATQVSVGTLAVANNLLIPAGIVVNVVFWNRDADIFRLALGGGIILLALVVNAKFTQKIQQTKLA